MNRFILLLLAPALLACSDDGSDAQPGMFGYQDCRIKMREQFLERGLHPTAADMQSKSTCEERFKSK